MSFKNAVARVPGVVDGVMKQSLIVLALLGGLMAPLWGQDGAQEKPKTAVVSIQTLFRGYYKTLEAQSQINAERSRIQKDDNEILQRVRVST